MLCKKHVEDSIVRKLRDFNISEKYFDNFFKDDIIGTIGLGTVRGLTDCITEQEFYNELSNRKSTWDNIERNVTGKDPLFHEPFTRVKTSISKQYFLTPLCHVNIGSDYFYNASELQ